MTAFYRLPQAQSKKTENCQDVINICEYLINGLTREKANYTILLTTIFNCR